ncbi:MAG: cytochrome c maturation protein CcmE [Hyphomonadaceae bacterium]|nr:cytochrome c maturation protein CcmE [Hyphomonadaceae bacterium]
MTRRRQRLIVLSVAAGFLVLAVGLVLNGINRSVSLFYAPHELAQARTEGRLIRLGGLVEAGSVARQGASLLFAVTDGQARVAVRFEGDPPDLFRENQGVVAEGRVLPDGSFKAERVLAKHDENYMPREVAKALQARGEWRGPSLQAPPVAEAARQGGPS